MFVADRCSSRIDVRRGSMFVAKRVRRGGMRAADGAQSCAPTALRRANGAAHRSLGQSPRFPEWIAQGLKARPILSGGAVSAGARGPRRAR